MSKVAAFVLASSFMLGPCSKETTETKTAEVPPQGITATNASSSPPPAAGRGCTPATTCRCDGVDACAMRCAEGNCRFECTGAGNCSFSCPGGSCTVNATGAGSATLSCPGGSCTMNCVGAGSCSVSGGKNSKCNKVGAGACTSS